MISKATVHKATVLMNRRIKTERRVTTFGPVCSSVAGMALHHPEGRRDMQEVSASVLRRIRDSLSSCYLCDAKSQMGRGRHGLAGFTTCVAECNFDWNVRVYRGRGWRLADSR